MTRSEFHLEHHATADHGSSSGPTVQADSTSIFSAADAGLARRGFLRVSASVAAAAAVNPNSAALAEPPKLTASKVVFAHSAAVTSLQFSQDGKRLASGSSDKAAKVWALSGGEPLFVGAHPESVERVAFVDDSLATACRDSEVRLWSLAGDAKVRRFSGHGKPVTWIGVQDAKHLLSVDTRGVVKQWIIGEAKVRKSWTMPARVSDIAYASDEQCVLAAEQARLIRIYSIKDSNTAATIGGHDPRASAITYHGPSRMMATGGAKGDVAIRSFDTPNAPDRVAQHEGRVFALVFSPDGKTLVSSGPKGMLISVPEEMATHNIPTAFPVTSLAISPDGRVLASGDAKGVITLWSLQRRELIGFIVDPKASDEDVILYRTRKVWTDRDLVFGLPSTFPAPAGVTRVADITHKEKKTSKPWKRRRKSAQERLADITRARQFYHQRKMQRREWQRQLAIARYEWYLSQLYQYHYGDYGYSSSSRTVCVCNTISY